MKPKDPHQYQRDRLEELQGAVCYPLKLKQDKDGVWFLAATAKGRTVDTGSVEASVQGGLFSIWYRDESKSEGSFLLQTHKEKNARLLIEMFCAALGMQPRIV